MGQTSLCPTPSAANGRPFGQRLHLLLSWLALPLALAAPVGANPPDTSARVEIPKPPQLEKPLTLVLTLDPPRDGFGEPWRVFVWRNSDPGMNNGAQVFQGTPYDGAQVRVKDQSAGTYSITVADSRRRVFFSERDIVILDPESAERRIEIVLVTIEGRLRLGGEPLAAKLWFGGFDTGRAQFESDPEGKFRGTLPKEGLWPVEIEATSPKVSVVHKVEVKTGAKGLAEVAIDLPNTLIFGRVVDEEDRPVAGALLVVENAHNRTRVWTSPEGKFEIRGFDPGALTLLASTFSDAGDRASEIVSATLSDRGPVGPLVLRVRESRRIEGQVQGDVEPAAVANLFILALPPRLGDVEVAQTGLDGRFAVNLPARIRRALIVVSSPGNALRAFDVPFDGTPLILRTPAAGGTLEVTLPDEKTGQLRDTLLLIYQNGLLLPLRELFVWAGEHDGKLPEGKVLRFPRLGEGRFDVCLVPHAAQTGLEYAGPVGSCVQGQLTAGSVLRLKAELGL